ncbi:MAG: hypothetical protein BZ138_04645 [Methanosphaera sp. rholeuAM270]|nr:MAG: hypothetical protein BZ138_04645 [Methanosphaera sp. rholeuAM270]
MKMDINFYTVLGELVVILIIILLILICITLILGFYLIYKQKLIFPSLLLFTLNLTYPTIKKLLVLFQLNDLIIDQISIDLRNRINRDKFKKLNAEEVIMVLPHCLRATNCPAVLGESGIECVCCGKCSIGIIKKISTNKGVDVYIVPGSTFIKNVLKKRPFKGVIGVACPLDLNLAMTSLEKFVPQGVYLLRDGCINTAVDVDEVIDLVNLTQPTTNYRKEDYL